MDAVVKSGQLERDFGVRHALRALRSGLRARDDAEVTPFQVMVAKRRIAELVGKGHNEEEACLILLMRGARVENLTVAMGYKVDLRIDETAELVADVRKEWNTHSEHPGWIDGMIHRSHEVLDLLRRA